MGADDYLTKPFSPRELVARVRVMPRRPRASVADTRAPMEEPPRTFGSLSVDVQTLIVLAGSVTLGLVAAAVGPTTFHDHLRQIAGHVDPDTVRHVEEAYASARCPWRWRR